MANLLLLLATRSLSRRSALRRAAVEIPTDVAGTDAIFLMLRRMRAPLILLIVIFAVSVFGLAAIEGVDGDGNPARLTVFDAFYFMSYTATTIGFGELPHPFTIAQRLWVTGSIYSSVIGWAYAIGTLFALLQDEGFRDAIRIQRFRRRVRRLDEPFHVIAGYGQSGRLICQALDESGRRAVVVDRAQARVERLESDQLTQDVPGVEADARHPGVLGLAGLGHRHCAGVLAVTDDDRANLAIVMAVKLLRPELPVIARCGNRTVQQQMAEFAPAAIVNPYDRYGAYLVLALRKPVTFQLATWLTSPEGTRLPPLREGLTDGHWVIAANGAFGAEVAADLRDVGLDVDLVDPGDNEPDRTPDAKLDRTPDTKLDLNGAVGFVAGADDDTVNLSLAAHARLERPEMFLSVRQAAHHNAALLAAFGLDSVFVPTELVATECLARIVTPAYWAFVDHIFGQDEAWSTALRDQLVERLGHRTPESARIRLDGIQAPAVTRWMVAHELTLGDLMRHPEDRDTTVAAVPVALIRGDLGRTQTGDVVAGTGSVPSTGEATVGVGAEAADLGSPEAAAAPAERVPDPEIRFCPDPSTRLRPGDELLVLGRQEGHRDLSVTLFQDSAIEYAATGRRVPSTWLWRVLTSRHARAGTAG